MNWLFWVVAAFMCCSVIDGYRKGFIKKLVSAFSVILTLALVTQMTPYITTFLRDYTSLPQSLQEKCSEFFVDESYDENVKAHQILMIEQMQLPDNLKEVLQENNHVEAYELLNVRSFSEYVGAYLAEIMINALTYLLSFIIVWTILRSIVLALDLVTKLPLLHGMNQMAGGFLGLAESVILIWVAFLVAGAFCNGTIGQRFFALIEESLLLSMLYDHNYIMNLIFQMIF